jgi:hypothetical protein
MDVDSLVESMSNLKIPRTPKTITFGRGTGYKGRFGNARRVEYNSNFNLGQISQHKKSKKKRSKEKEADNNETLEVMEDVEFNKK